MSHYTRGATFERKVKKYYEDQGWFCVRAAGSHGVADVVALMEGTILLVSCRINGKWTAKEWKDLRDACTKVLATPILAYRNTKTPLITRICPFGNPRGVLADAK